jgi:hypothetical protein
MSNKLNKKKTKKLQKSPYQQATFGLMEFVTKKLYLIKLLQIASQCESLDQWYQQCETHLSNSQTYYNATKATLNYLSANTPSSQPAEVDLFQSIQEDELGCRLV